MMPTQMSFDIDFAFEHFGADWTFVSFFMCFLRVIFQRIHRYERFTANFTRRAILTIIVQMICQTFFSRKHFTANVTCKAENRYIN